MYVLCTRSNQIAWIFDSKGQRQGVSLGAVARLFCFLAALGSLKKYLLYYKIDIEV